MFSLVIGLFVVPRERKVSTLESYQDGKFHSDHITSYKGNASAGLGYKMSSFYVIFSFQLVMVTEVAS